MVFITKAEFLLEKKINTGMTYGDHRLFLYENTIDLVINTGTPNFYRDNRAMNKKVLVAHKGVANEVYFNVRDRDRKLQNLFTDQIRAYVIHPTTKQRVFTRLLEHPGDIGKLKLTIYPSDIQNVCAGLYHIYLTRSTTETEELPIYTDQNDNMRFDLKVTDQVSAVPIATQEANSFVQVANTALSDPANVFASSALDGNLNRNFQDAQHTMVIWPTGYTGQVTIQASCVTQTPGMDDLSDDWFDVQVIDLANANLATQVNFTSNVNWVRALHAPTIGSIDRIQLRN